MTTPTLTSFAVPRPDLHVRPVRQAFASTQVLANTQPHPRGGAPAPWGSPAGLASK